MTDSEELAHRALQHFRHGFDTVDIAKRLGVTEARASRLLWLARSHAIGKPADFLKAGTIRRVAANLGRVA